MNCTVCTAAALRLGEVVHGCQLSETVNDRAPFRVFRVEGSWITLDTGITLRRRQFTVLYK